MNGKKELWIGRNMYMLKLGEILSKNFGNLLLGSILVNNTSISVSVKKEKLNKLMFFLKNSSFFGFRSLIDILGVDCLGRSDGFRFMVYYVFYNRNLGFSFSLKVFLGLYDLITTSTNLYKAAGWAEREVYDMFGIYFHKNEDMRRILTDYGFVGFPLRKEFPLSGYFELQYSEEYKTVISLPTKLGQAFRKFSPGLNWGGLIN